jgi:hypothetical protein
LEVALRLFQLAPPVQDQYGHHVADLHLPFRARPWSRFVGRSASGEFAFPRRHNGLGFRDIEHSRDKPPSVFRILGLGDSFAYGIGAAFQDTFLYRLESKLNRRAGLHPKVEIVKAGIPAAFPETQRVLLQHEGLAFHPDLVLVAFLPNDVIDTAAGLGALQLTSGGYLRSREAAVFGEAGTFLYLHSHLGRLLLGRYVAWRRVRDYRWPEVYREGGFHEQDWREVERQYEAMLTLVRGTGARMVLVHIPQQNLSAPDASYPSERLGRWSAAHGVAFVDTLPALRQAARRKKSLYWPKDGHCTAEGYRVIANVIFREMELRHLVP